MVKGHWIFRKWSKAIGFIYRKFNSSKIYCCDITESLGQQQTREHSSQGCPHIWHQLQVWRVPQTILWFHNSWEGLTELTASYYTHNMVYYREMTQVEISQGKKLIWQSLGEVLHTGSFHCGVSTHYSASINVWWYAWNTVNRSSSSGPLCPEFLLGLHYMGMIHWLPTWWISVSRSTDTAWPRAPIL